MTMTDDLVKRLDDINRNYDLARGVHSTIRDAKARIEALTAERDRLLSTVNALESLRPHWAQGYSSDSIAAQASTEALVGIWKILGVNDQTSAVVTLKALTANNARLRAALQPLVKIADAYDENELDDEARKHWTYGTNDTPHEDIELYQGRGGRQLLTLKDCMVARAALNTGKADT